MQQTVFSGIKPTGEIHLGNYLGALKNWVTLQNSRKYRCLYSIVDYHALTVDIQPETLRENTHNLAIDLLAIGIDPKKSLFFRQSDVPEHTELAWLFDCLTPVAELDRMTQYKDFIQRKKGNANAGLLTYPVLQAADILIYHATHVPVGEDQLQHLELSRIIARKFNNRYGTYFGEVKPIVNETMRIMSLTDPAKKMSKSLGPKSYIALRDKPEVVREKISKAVTDSLDTTTTLSGGHNLLELFKQFAETERYAHYEREYQLKKLSYAQLKQELTEALLAFLAPIQERQRYYDKHTKEVHTTLKSGAKKARSLAQKTLVEVRRLVGLD